MKTLQRLWCRIRGHNFRVVEFNDPHEADLLLCRRCPEARVLRD